MHQRTIGHRIRELRLGMGLTTNRLSKRVGISEAEVSRLENGLVSFRTCVLVRFAKALKVSPVYFFMEGQNTLASKFTKELNSRGLTPTRTLCRAIAHPGFLRFLEMTAKAAKACKKNLAKMEEAVERAIR
jgi:transcriptional regulator with XRE-family HTH domain